MKKIYLFIWLLFVLLSTPLCSTAQDTVIENPTAGELSSLLTDKDVTSLVISGEINRADLDYINLNLNSLKNLDLRNTKITEWTDPYDPEWGYYAADAFPSSFTANSVIERLVLPESITSMGISCLNNPTKLKKLISYSVTPPMADEYYPFIGSAEFLSNCELYVPKEAIENYKNAPGWGFSVIKDIASEGSDTPIVDKDYELSEDGKTLIKWKGKDSVINMNNYEELANVEIIGPAAFGTTDFFATNDVITEVTLSENITEIGDNAFSSCIALEKVKLGSKVKNIGIGAFMSCEKLNNVVLPASVESMGRACFSGCTMLTSIEWPVAITEIPNSVFYKCTGLTTIKIPAKVTVINNSVFEECSSLETIVWGDALEEIGYSAFGYCNSLKELSLPNSLKKVGEDAFVSCENLTSIKFGGVENIGASAFKGCAISKTDFATSNIKEIGSYTFSNNPLTEVSLPSSITTLGECAFQNCTELTTATIPVDAPLEAISDRVFKLCYKLTDVNMGSVKTIGNGTFSMCGSLENITWSNSLISIGGTAFMSCNMIKSINLPESVQTLDDWAFYECNGLESLTIGNELTTIGQECFALCSSLKNIEIGNGLTTIKKWAFQKNAIESFKVLSESVPTLEEDVFMECDLSSSTLIVADGMKADYENADQWKEFGKIEDVTTTNIENANDITKVIAIYSLDGNRLIAPSKGVNVIIMDDGSVKKVLIK